MGTIGMLGNVFPFPFSHANRREEILSRSIDLVDVFGKCDSSIGANVTAH
jgi:hypothetical protein